MTKSITSSFCRWWIYSNTHATDGPDDWGGDWENEVSAEAHWSKGREGAYISTDANGESPEGCTP